MVNEIPGQDCRTIRTLIRHISKFFSWWLLYRNSSHSGTEGLFRVFGHTALEERSRFIDLSSSHIGELFLLPRCL
jgi:hypothetical protein